MSSDELEQCIELLCQRGCAAVRQIITELEAERPVDGTERLSAEGRRRVLAELKSIMAVYGDSCPLPGQR